MFNILPKRKRLQIEYHSKMLSHNLMNWVVSALKKKGKKGKEAETSGNRLGGNVIVENYLDLRAA